MFGEALHTVCATRLLRAAEVVDVLALWHQSTNTTVVVRHSGFVDEWGARGSQRLERMYCVCILHINGGLNGQIRGARAFVCVFVSSPVRPLLNGQADVFAVRTH